MTATTYTDFRQHLNQYMQKINDDADTLHVINTANPDRNIVVISEQDYNSMMETLHILNQPKLADQIRRGMRDVREHRNLEHHALIED